MTTTKPDKGFILGSPKGKYLAKPGSPVYWTLDTSKAQLFESFKDAEYNAQNRGLSIFILYEDGSTALFESSHQKE